MIVFFISYCQRTSSTLLCSGIFAVLSLRPCSPAGVCHLLYAYSHRILTDFWNGQLKIICQWLPVQASYFLVHQGQLSAAAGSKWFYVAVCPRTWCFSRPYWHLLACCEACHPPRSLKHSRTHGPALCLFGEVRVASRASEGPWSIALICAVELSGSLCQTTEWNEPLGWSVTPSAAFGA